MNRPYEQSRSAGSRRQERRSRSRSRSRSVSSSDDESYQRRAQRRQRPDEDLPKPPSFPRLAFEFKGKSSHATQHPAKPTTQRFQAPSAKVLPVQMKLATKTEPTKKLSVASAFSNNDSDDEVEEMPAECRMRMRNIGRDTPTSSGPNSFGKTKYGFCDAKNIYEKNLNEPDTTTK